MKHLIFLFLILFAFTLIAQTNVDKVTEKLVQLSTASYDNWRYTENHSLTVSELSDPVFDDSRFLLLKLDERIFPDSCWLRKVITVPRFIGGVPVSGRMKMLFEVDDYGELFVNGKFIGNIPWSGEFLITEDSKPGDQFVVIIKAHNTGGPLRLMRAELDFGEYSPVKESIKNLVLSLRTGQKLLSFDTYQTNDRVKVDPEIDKSKFDKQQKQKLNDLLQELVTYIDVEALANGNIKKFSESIDLIKDRLIPIAEFAKQFTLQFTSNAHIDAAWLWRKKETIEVCNKTFSSVMNMFEARQDFTYVQSQAVMYEWMQKFYPDLFNKIKQKYNEGRWEIVGGLWVEPDCNLPSGESWSRQLLYAQKYFEHNFGKKALIGWNPDSFGYNWNMPQFYLNAGIDAFITQKIGWNDTNVFPYRVFWWQGPDGSRILTYFPFGYVNTIENPYGLVDQLRQFEANTGFTKLCVLFGVGDHGGGPSLEMMNRIDKLKEIEIFPNIEFNTANSYINYLKQQDLSELPVWNNELYLEYHRGTFTTQAKTKENNRSSEVLLTNTEKFSSFSSLLGGDYNKNDIDDSWKIVMFNQFHDILPGSSIREVYFDAEQDYNEAKEIGKFNLNNALEFISKNINSSFIKTGKQVTVFNPLSWKRSDVAVIELAEGNNKDYSVFDSMGNEIPSQSTTKGRYSREILFLAEDVPSLGYKVYELRERKPAKYITTLSYSDSLLENEYFKVELNLRTGWISQIYDKTTSRNLLTEEGNRLQILEDKPYAWDAWNIGLTGVEYPSTFRKLEVTEAGPVIVKLKAYRDYLKPGEKKEYPTEYFPSSFAEQEIILYSGVNRVDFITNIEWWEEKTMLKVAFPVNIKNEIASYEIPYGFINRSTTLEDQWDKGKWEVPALRWADLSANGYGISLLNKSKYGYDIKGNVMRLSLLRSPKWPDPTADRGNHSIEYSLYSHTGDISTGETVKKGYEYNYPLLIQVSDKHSGRLPAEHSFIEITDGSVIISSIKKALDDDALVIQLYESVGNANKIEIILPYSIKKAVECNFLEEEISSINYSGNKLNLMFDPFKVKTLKVYLK